MTTIQCNQNKNIEDLNILVKDQVGTVGKDIAVIDPFVEVCLACCTPSGLCGTPILHLSEALDAIVTCICNLEGRVKAAEKNAGDAWDLVSKLQTQVSNLNKAVCVEAGMIALRRDATEISHEDFTDAVSEVQAKKKVNLQYYA